MYVILYNLSLTGAISLIVDTDDCTLFTSTGAITTDYYPTGYPNNAENCWVIEAPQQQVHHILSPLPRIMT